MTLAQLEQAMEAILFAGGEPVPIQRIALALEQENTVIEHLAQRLQERYQTSGSGLELLRLEDSFQLATRPELQPYVRAALEAKRGQSVSPAALEVLAVVAYNQPVTKSFVEQVRGVDCSGVLSTLVERELVEEAGRLELPGRPIAYKTTANFLRCFGLSSLEDLPPLPQDLLAQPVEETDPKEQDSPTDSDMASESGRKENAEQ